MLRQTNWNLSMITPIFAGLLTLLYIYLSTNVIGFRRTNRIGLGDGGDPHLLRLMRVHSNCAEYAPLGVLLILMLELQNAPVWLLLGVGLMLLAGRCIHAFGVGGAQETRGARTLGMALTLTALGVSGLANMFVALT